MALALEEPRKTAKLAALEDGAAVLESVYEFVGRFIAYPSNEARAAHVLWIVHTHVMEAWESTPRIAFLSPEPGSGKTRALEISELLVPRPVEAVNVTPAYLFRKVGDHGGKPTILFDEIDTVFGPKARENEEIRGLLNAGHRRGAVAGRCVVRGNSVQTEEIPAYCAVALAGIGDLPDTILTRSIVIRMKRRGPGEQVEPYRRRIHSSEGEKLHEKISGWATSVVEALTTAWPRMPEGIEDRNADVWEPLLAIADVAGGRWPDLVRVAAVTLVTESRKANPSLGIRLLADLQRVFGGEESKPTSLILEALHALDESPWADIKGKPLNGRGLAARLQQYSIRPKVIRIGSTTHRGYVRTDFLDAWSRYLEPSLQECVTSVTGVTKGLPKETDDD